MSYTKRKLSYLAAPYSTGLVYRGGYDLDEEDWKRVAMDERARDIARNVAWLHERGEFVYSPITHGYGYEQYVSEANKPSHDFWLPHCYEILSRCDEMLILQLPGWDKSFGIKKEMELCAELGIPVRYMEPI